MLQIDEKPLHAHTSHKPPREAGCFASRATLCFEFIRRARKKLKGIFVQMSHALDTEELNLSSTLRSCLDS